MEKIWSVDVSVNGENILTIGSDWLSGKASLTTEDEDTIEKAAKSLLSFIGRPINKVIEDGQAECAHHTTNCGFDKKSCGSLELCEFYTPAT